MTLVREFTILFAITLAGAAYSLVSGLAPAPWAEPSLQPGEIRLDEALRLDPVWVDARTAAEYEAARIPDALHLEEADWDAGLLRLMEVWTPGRPIVVYCSSAACGTSKRVAEALDRALGGVEAYALHGGWEAWPK